MQKNYWPIAIVGIILFGIVIISIGVMIAVKNPVVDEEMYGGKKRDIDEHINVILKEQKDFESTAKATLRMGDEEIALQTPYLIKKPPKQSAPLVPEFTEPFIVSIGCERIGISAVNLSITSFMQGVEDSRPIALSLDTKNLRKYGSDYILPAPLVFAKDGRYKLSFHIIYEDFADANTTKSAYFEQEIFYRAK